jgi:hypothetical protein
MKKTYETIAALAYVAWSIFKWAGMIALCYIAFSAIGAGIIELIWPEDY